MNTYRPSAKTHGSSGLACAISTCLVLTVCTTEIHADVAEGTVETNAIDPQSLTTLRLGPSALSSVFETQELLSDASCRMKVGAVETRGLAVVWIRRKGYTHFQVIDSLGIAFEGSFKSRSIHTKFQLGRNAQGDVILGFLEDGVLQIVGNGKRVYSGHSTQIIKGWGLARDGQRFFVVSRQQSETTIVIYDSQGTIENSQPTWSQTERMVVTSSPKPQGYYFSNDQNDIEHFSFMEPHTQTFYAVDTNDNRQFAKRRDLTGIGTVRFESRNVAYILDTAHGEEEFSKQVSIIKRQWIEYDSQETYNDVWTRYLDLPHVFSLSLSQNGKYLIVHAVNMHVLDSGTGETLLAYPTTRNLAIQLASEEEDPDWWSLRSLVRERYSRVASELVKEIQDPEDIVPIWDGWTPCGVSLAGLEVVEDTLRFVTIPSSRMWDECSNHDGTLDEDCFEQMKAATLDECESLSNVYARNTCREDLTGLNIVYTFDLKPSRQDSRPTGRFAVPADDRCHSAIPGWGGLRWTDGKVTYVPD